MRDRLISVAISREPETPAFRVPERKPLPDVATASTPTLTEVKGIGPVYATRLAAAGVNTVDDLAARDPNELASAAEVPVARARGWIESARALRST